MIPGSALTPHRTLLLPGEMAKVCVRPDGNGWNSGDLCEADPAVQNCETLTIRG